MNSGRLGPMSLPIVLALSGAMGASVVVSSTSVSFVKISSDPDPETRPAIAIGVKGL